MGRFEGISSALVPAAGTPREGGRIDVPSPFTKISAKIPTFVFTSQGRQPFAARNRGAGKSVPMSHSRHATCLSCSHFRVDGSGMRPNHLRCHENGILVPAPVRAGHSIKPRFDRQRHAPRFIAWMSRMSPRHMTLPAFGPGTQAFRPPCTLPLRSGLLERTRQRHSLVLEVTARHLEHHWCQQDQADQVGNRHQPVQRV